MNLDRRSAAVNTEMGLVIDSPELVAEVADLWFHTMLLLARDDLDPLAPLELLQQRRKPSI